MKKKLPIRIRLKTVIDALREGKKRYRDLAKLGVPEKTLSRILKDYLEYLGLAYQDRDGFWVWHDQFRIFYSVDEYDRAIEHSKNLVLSLGSLLLEDIDPKTLFPPSLVQREKLKPGLTVGEALQNKQFVEEHLRTGYPSIYNELVEWRRLRSKLIEMGKDKMQEFRERFGNKTGNFLITRYKKMRKGSLFRKIFSKTVVEIEEYPEGTLWGPFEVGSEEEKRFMELMERIPEKIKEGYFKNEEEMEKAYAKLAGNIQLLIMRIHNGTPLEGACQLCPQIRVSSWRERAKK